MSDSFNSRDQVHLIIPFQVPEEDGLSGILLVLTKHQAGLLAEAIRDASLLMTNREFFATKAQWLTIDIDKHCEGAYLIDNTPEGEFFVIKHYNEDFEKPFFIENLSDFENVEADIHSGDFDWSLFIGTAYGEGVPFMQFILESNVGIARISGHRISTNQIEVELFLKSLKRTLNEDRFPDLIGEE